MTVCIAALYGGGKGVVLASDHMITANIPMGYQFENDETSKIHPLSEDSCALFAGNVLFGDPILQQSRAIIAGEGQKYVGEIAEIVKNSYKDFRLSYIEERYLAPRGLTLEAYYGRQESLNPGIIQVVDQAMATEDIGVEFIVVGPTGAGYGIYIISNPGLSACLDAIGFSAIGSGAPHVLYSLLGATYKKSLGESEVKKLVKQAKKMSEVAPGVGKQTSVRVLPAEEENDAKSGTEEDPQATVG